MPPVLPVPQSLGASGVAFLSLAVLCWVICLLFVFSVAGKDVHGDAVVGQAYGSLLGMGFAVLAWLWIGGLLLKAGVEDVLPADGIALALYLASGVAGAAALFLIMDRALRVWPVAILVLLPAVMIFYVFALYQPSLRPFFLQPRVSIAAAGLALALCGAPLPASISMLVGGRVNRAAEKQAVDAHTRAKNLEKLQTIPADASLMDYLDLVRDDSGVRTEALEKVRRLDRRQQDIEEMLEAGVPAALRLIPELDLQPTQRLCEAAGNYLRKYAKDLRRRPKQDPREYGGGWVEESVPALRWLIAHGCDCEATVAAMEASLGTFLDTPEREAALTALTDLRTKK